MLHSTTTKQQDILKTQSDAENDPNLNSSQLITRKSVDGTPFYVVGTEEKGYFVVLGKYKIAETGKTEEEAIENLEKDKWKVIVNLITTINTIMDNTITNLTELK